MENDVDATKCNWDWDACMFKETDIRATYHFIVGNKKIHLN